MTDRAQPMVLRGYVHGRDRHWQAICLDLDIAAQGESMDEARRTLNEMVDDYLEEIEALPEPERTRLLNRKAPLRVRVAHHLGYALAVLFARKTGGDRLSYTLHNAHGSRPCAA